MEKEVLGSNCLISGTGIIGWTKPQTRGDRHGVGILHCKIRAGYALEGFVYGVESLRKVWEKYLLGLSLSNT